MINEGGRGRYRRTWVEERRGTASLGQGAPDIGKAYGKAHQVSKHGWGIKEGMKKTILFKILMWNAPFCTRFGCRLVKIAPSTSLSVNFGGFSIAMSCSTFEYGGRWEEKVRMSVAYAYRTFKSTRHTPCFEVCPSAYPPSLSYVFGIDTTT